MITEDQLTQRLKSAFPDAEIQLKDLTGGQDHWQAEITSEAFVGLPLLARHRKVYAALADEMKGPIHALALKTLAPGEEV
jgi:stress-induced morphogen